MAGYIGSKEVNLSTTGADINGDANIDGTLTSDGLTVDGDGQINQTAGNASTLTFTSNGQASRYSRIKVDTDRSLILTAGVGAVNETPDIKLQTGTATGEKDRILIDGATGDISFYEDTGTTPKFFWDASAERLGLGTTSPSSNIDIEDAAEVKIDLNSTAGRIYRLRSTTDSKFIIRDSSASADRLSIDSSGNVGIGTDSPASLLHLESSSPVIRIKDTDGAAYHQVFASLGDLYIDSDRGNNVATSSIIFRNDATERMRIDSSGNLLVGTTNSLPADNNVEGIALSPQYNGGIIQVSRTGQAGLTVNRRTSDGNIALFKKDGSTVGSIGVTNTIGIRNSYIAGTLTGLSFANASIFPTNQSGAVADNQKDLGYGSGRFDDIFATNGTINTSDRNEKQDIEVLSDAEQRVAVAAKGLMRKFRWRDAVEAKGDEARTHFGIIAQDLQAAFAAEGLDAGDYAMFISTTWWETQTEVPAVEAVEEVLDEDGNVVTEAVEAADAYTRTDTYDTQEEAPEGATERTRLGVRYSELLAFIIGAL